MVYEKLSARLARDGRLAWVAEEMAALTDPASYRADPETMWERLLTHEYNECWLYYSFMEQESDPRIKAIWELHLQMEFAQFGGIGFVLRPDRRESGE